MKTTNVRFRCFVLLAGLLTFVTTNVHAQSEDYSDFYGEGEIVVLEPFTVSAEPEQAWVNDYENVWEDFLNENLWNDLDAQIWEDFVDSLPSEIAFPNNDCSTAKEKAQLAQAAYGGVNQVGNNVKVTNPDDVGLTAGDLSHSASGFSATVFQHSSTNKITVSFAGTNNIPDIGTDIGQSFGLQSTQYDKAMDLAVKIVDENPGVEIEFVGHSLGGGLASAAALVVDKHAATYNAAGLHSDTVEDRGSSLASANSLIDAYYVAGEIVSTAQDTSPLPNAAGTRHRLTPASSLQWYEPLEKHFIQSVIDSFPC